MTELRGISASPGVAIGKAFLYLDDVMLEIPRYGIAGNDVDTEWDRFQGAVETAKTEVAELRDRADREMGREHAQIFEAHLLMLDDINWFEQVRERLERDLRNIEWIVHDYTRELSQKLSASSDTYLRERVLDIHDISRRLVNNLLSVNRRSLADLDEDVILITHNLLPSDTLLMDKQRVKGIAMDVGGRTSHTAILARAFEIPAVLGLSEATKEIADGSTIIVDGLNGLVIVDPDESTIKRYVSILKNHQQRNMDLLADRDLPAVTTDGHSFILKANIELPEEAAMVAKYGAEGIGLYRSEFLFLGPGRLSDEEEQYAAYRSVVEAMGDRPVTIRTLDVGGDKLIPDLQSVEEKNPLLGWRAIRFCLARPELFKTQLRALLRASAHGNLRIMFPMISGLEELEATLSVFEDAKEECRKRHQPIDETLVPGIMIEIPSAAMIADILSRRASFFSIGTNDLVQYSLATDRGNEQVAYLAQPFHPGVLRFIKMPIDAAHERGIPAAMCGELAGDPQATAILIGLGLDEFSMSASSIPRVKRIIRSVSRSECRDLAEKALAQSSYRPIEDMVMAWMGERFPAL
jgi:phosphotransferase system enzyme I (PtsI)